MASDIPDRQTGRGHRKPQADGKRLWRHSTINTHINMGVSRDCCRQGSRQINGYVPVHGRRQKYERTHWPLIFCQSATTDKQAQKENWTSATTSRVQSSSRPNIKRRLTVVCRKSKQLSDGRKKWEICWRRRPRTRSKFYVLYLIEIMSSLWI